MADALSSQDLSSLIGSVYDCALDPGRWEHTLAAIRDALNCESAVLNLTDLDNNCFLVYRTVGIDPHWQQEQKKHLREIHARLVEHLASAPLDEPHVISRHISPAHREVSPYYQQCLRPQGLIDIMQYFLLYTSTRLASFSVARNDRQGVITEREIALGRLLLPHVRRAVTIGNVLDVQTIERARMAEALDALRCAVILTDGRGVILHANRSAEAMLKNGGPVQGTGRVLQAKFVPAAAELRGAIALAARDEASIGKKGFGIRLTAPEASPFFAHVLPLGGSELRSQLQPEAVAAVFIGVSADDEDGAETVATAFGLTKSEKRVLASILAGRTLNETATTLGIAATTAKTHLDNIFSKTGVTRQADLIRLGNALVPPTRPKV